MNEKDLWKYTGAKIKELRTSNDMSQEELGAKLGLSKQAIGKYENGHRDPGQDNLFAIARIFNVSINYFFPDETNDKDRNFQAYDTEALEVAAALSEAGKGEINILFKKTAKADPKQQEQLIKILKTLLPDDED